MRKATAKELRGLVNKGLDLTLKEMEALSTEDYNELLQATTELVSRNIKASDKEEYIMFLDTLKEYTPAGAPAPEVKKVANTKAPKKPTPAPKTPAEPTPAPAPKKSKEAPAKTKEAPKKSKENKPANKLKVGDTVKFQVEGETVKHDIKIINVGRYNIVGIMVEDETEVFNIRKADFNKQVFGWTDKHNETYNIIVTL